VTHVLQRVAQTRLWHHGPALLGAVGVSLVLLTLPAEDDIRRAVAAVAILQLALVVSWAFAFGFRGHLGSVLIGTGAAIGADLVAVRAGDPDAPSDPGERLGPLAAVVALAFVLSFVHQLSRRAPRVDVAGSMSGVALLTAMVIAPSAYVILVQLADGPALLETCVAAIAAAVVVGHVVDLLLPYPRIVEGVPRGLLGFVLGTGAAMFFADRTDGADGLVAQLGALILGGVLGGLACLLAIGASYAAVEDRGPRLAQAAVQAVLPFAAAAPVAYFVAILVGG